LGPGLVIALLHSRDFMRAYNTNMLSPATLKTRQKTYQEPCFHPFRDLQSPLISYHTHGSRTPYR
jgi:hypothetical protein